MRDIVFGSSIRCFCNLFFIRLSFLKLTVDSYSALLIGAALVIFQACLILVASVRILLVSD